MLCVKKILVVLLVASLLAPLSFSLLNEEPDVTVVVNEIKIDTDYAKPPGTPGVKPDKPDKPDRTTGDYKLTGNVWNENLPLDGLAITVGEGVNVQVIFDSANEWDSYTSKNLISTVTGGDDVDIFDELPAADAPNGNPDGINEVVLASSANFQAGVIAVCYTWFNPDTNEIMQFDIAFNDYYTWGDADPDNDGVGDSTLMDLQNIATHELGHGLGLADLYKRKLSDLTMYGYSGYGDVAKRTLEQGDIDGIQALYGE